MSKIHQSGYTLAWNDALRYSYAPVCNEDKDEIVQ